MKKIIALTLCLAMASVLFAFADGEPFANAGELYQNWYQTNGSDIPYPEYVTGVWSADGSGDNLTFAIMKGYEDQAKAEILDQIADKNSVTFAEGGKYTMAQLKKVQDYIGGKMSEGAGTYPIWGCGIQDKENAVVCEINTSNDKAQSVMDELSKEYGDMVQFNESSAVAATETIASAENEIAQYAAGEESAVEEDEIRHELPLEHPPIADIIAYVLIGIGVAAIITSVIILKKKKNEMLKKK